MSFYIPILCPVCLEKIFFYQKINEEFGVADSIDSQIHYHLCPFIKGANYWKTTSLQRCFLFIKQKEQDITKMLLENNPPIYLKRTTRIAEVGILLKCEKKESLDKLYFANFDFADFYLFVEPQKQWDIGKAFKITRKTVVKSKSNFISRLELITKEKTVSLEKINNNIFLMELRGENLNLLEKGEAMILQKLQRKKFFGQKLNKIIAVYPQNPSSGFARKIVFFLEDKVAVFFASLALPNGITFSLLQKEFLLNLKDLQQLDI